MAASAAATGEAARSCRLTAKARSPWRDNVRRLFRQRSALTGMIILGIVVFAAVFAPLIAPYEPNQVLIGAPGHEDVRKREKPCIHALGCPEDEPQHIMGLDGNVRDVFSRILYGARISLFVGFVVVFVAMSVGTILGAIGGFAGGWIDNVIMRFMDVLLAFPSLLLAIAIAFVLTPGLLNAMLAISIVTIPAYARVVRSTVLSARRWTTWTPRARSAPATCASSGKQIMPNVLSPLIVLGTLGHRHRHHRCGRALVPWAWARNRPHRNGAPCSAVSSINSSARRIWCSSPALPS